MNTQSLITLPSHSSSNITPTPISQNATSSIQLRSRKQTTTKKQQQQQLISSTIQIPELVKKIKQSYVTLQNKYSQCSQKNQSYLLNIYLKILDKILDQVFHAQEKLNSVDCQQLKDQKCVNYLEDICVYREQCMIIKKILVEKKGLLKNQRKITKDLECQAFQLEYLCEKKQKELAGIRIDVEDRESKEKVKVQNSKKVNLKIKKDGNDNKNKQDNLKINKISEVIEDFQNQKQTPVQQQTNQLQNTNNSKINFNSNPNPNLITNMNINLAKLSTNAHPIRANTHHHNHHQSEHRNPTQNQQIKCSTSNRPKRNIFQITSQKRNKNIYSCINRISQKLQNKFQKQSMKTGEKDTGPGCYSQRLYQNNRDQQKDQQKDKEKKMLVVYKNNQNKIDHDKQLNCNTNRSDIKIPINLQQLSQFTKTQKATTKNQSSTSRKQIKIQKLNKISSSLWLYKPTSLRRVKQRSREKLLSSTSNNDNILKNISILKKRLKNRSQLSHHYQKELCNFYQNFNGDKYQGQEQATSKRQSQIQRSNFTCQFKSRRTFDQ